MPEKGTTLPALLLIALGSCFPLIELGLDIPGCQQIWPVLPLTAGLVLLIRSLLEGQVRPSYG